MFNHKLKTILFSLSVLIMSFVMGLVIFAWTEPSQAPPEGNVPTPINVGVEPQAKVGRISATEFGDSNNPSYFLNPEGNSLFGGMTETNTLRLTPRTQPTTPQEGQLYFDSELHAFCYYNGSDWICLAEPEAPPGLCADWPTQTDDLRCGDIDCSGWYVQTGDEGSTQTEYCYNKQDITTDRCEGVDDCKDENSPDCDAQSNDALRYSCGTCCYISSASCTGTTQGSCSYYSSATQGLTSDYYWTSGSASPTGTNYCYKRDYHCTGNSCGETYTDVLQYSCGDCKYVSGCSGGTLGSCTNYADKTVCSGTYGGCYGGTCYENYKNGKYWAFKESNSYGPNTVYSTAKSKCDNLVENGWSDWRLPSLPGDICINWQEPPQVPNNPFTPSWIWSSTSLTPGWRHVWSKGYNNCKYGEGVQEAPEGNVAPWRCMRP